MFAWYARMSPRPRFPPIYTPPTSRSNTRNSPSRSLAHYPQHSRPHRLAHHTQLAPPPRIPQLRTRQHDIFKNSIAPASTLRKRPKKQKNLDNCIRPPTNPNRDLAAPPQQPSPKLPPQSPRSPRPPLLRTPHSHPARFQTLRQPPAAATARSFSTRHLDN